jgi:UDP-glucose 4-epimerase
MVEIFGSDYDTPDGTPVRDYIHVTDLARAHLAALDHLEADGHSAILNCGYGVGTSVAEALDSGAALAGHSIAVRQAPRRPGDVDVIVADSRRLRELLGWQPRHDDLRTIIGSALAFERGLLPAPMVGETRPI